MPDRINYDSDEISNIVSKIGDYTNIVQNDVEYSLNNDFTILRELDLFSDGLDLLLSKSDNIVYLSNKLVNFMNIHESDLNDLENSNVALFNKEKIEAREEEVYSGSVISADEIVLNKIDDGKKILIEYVEEVVPSFSYDIKLEVLNRILNDNTNSLSILTNSEESDILIYQLKDILSDKYSIQLDKLTKEEEKEIQKSFFESISDNDTNIFDELDIDTFLQGLSYYKQVAKKNGISEIDLLFDDNNKDMFMDAIKEIYNNSDQIDVLTDSEIKSVKNYIDEVASTNNIDVNKLLSNSKYSSLVKGGINNED